MVKTMLTRDQVWHALEQVLDPEVPAVSICELGIVRDVTIEGGLVSVAITPTYSGCPATEMIEAEICQTLRAAGAEAVRVERRLTPAWSTDWITPAASEKLREYGIAPPSEASAHQPTVIRFMSPTPRCPRCGSARTVRVSKFGSTACKALYRCNACLEPFDYFKPL
jgi:ring-1,2-phenylacetyl-CoA epoxidase subunit PaaD